MSLSYEKLIVSIGVNFLLISTISAVILYGKRGMKFRSILAKSIILGLIAAVIIFATDLATGGLATISMGFVYVFTFMTFIALYIINPSFFFTNALFAFWMIFVTGMMIALSFGFAIGRISSSISTFIENLDISKLS